MDKQKSSLDQIIATLVPEAAVQKLSSESPKNEQFDRSTPKINSVDMERPFLRQQKIKECPNNQANQEQFRYQSIFDFIDNEDNLQKVKSNCFDAQIEKRQKELHSTNIKTYEHQAISKKALNSQSLLYSNKHEQKYESIINNNLNLVQQFQNEKLNKIRMIDQSQEIGLRQSQEIGLHQNQEIGNQSQEISLHQSSSLQFLFPQSNRKANTEMKSFVQKRDIKQIDQGFSLNKSKKAFDEKANQEDLVRETMKSNFNQTFFWKSKGDLPNPVNDSIKQDYVREGELQKYYKHKDAQSLHCFAKFRTMIQVGDQLKSFESRRTGQIDMSSFIASLKPKIQTKTIASVSSNKSLHQPRTLAPSSGFQLITQYILFYQSKQNVWEGDLQGQIQEIEEHPFFQDKIGIYSETCFFNDLKSLVESGMVVIESKFRSFKAKQQFQSSNSGVSLCNQNNISGNQVEKNKKHIYIIEIQNNLALNLSKFYEFNTLEKQNILFKLIKITRMTNLINILKNQNTQDSKQNFCKKDKSEIQKCQSSKKTQGFSQPTSIVDQSFESVTLIKKNLIQNDTKNMNAKLMDQSNEQFTLNSGLIQPYQPGNLFEGELKHYQSLALAWMLFREGFPIRYNLSDHDINTQWEPLNPRISPVLHFNIKKSQIVDFMPRNVAKGGILADQVGLGKTVMIISLMTTHFLDRSARIGMQTGNLIVAPLTILGQWRDAIHRHAPRMKLCLILKKSQITQRKIKQADIVLTGQSLFKTLFNKNSKSKSLQKELSFHNFKWLRLVIDEAHMLRNYHTIYRKSASQLDAQYKWLLTGTPIQNRIQDLCSYFKILGCSSFDNPAKMEHMSVNGIIKSKYALEKIRSTLKGIMIRRKKESISETTGKKLVQLEKQDRKVVKVKLTPEERKSYVKISLGVIKDIETLIKITSNFDGQFSKNSGVSYKKLSFADRNQLNSNILTIFGTITRMRQFCCHPSLAERDSLENQNHQDPQNLLAQTQPNQKISKLLKLCRNLKFDEKAIVFTQFIGMIKLIKHFLMQANIPCLSMQGSDKIEARLDKLKLFQSSNQYKVFVISTKVGNVGLNLQIASKMFFMDPWWNPAVEDQAIGRVHRIGQNKKVQTYSFITEGTVEEGINLMCMEKRTLYDMVLQNSSQNTDKKIKKLKWWREQLLFELQNEKLSVLQEKEFLVKQEEWPQQMIKEQEAQEDNEDSVEENLLIQSD